MTTHHLIHRAARGAAALLLVAFAAACSETADPTAPSSAPSLARGGPNQLPTSTARIVFSSFMGGNHDLYSVNPDGSDLRRLTFGGDAEVFPAVSPDGKQIAFVRIAAGAQQGDLWIMNSDGTKPRLRLAAGDSVQTIHGPVWTPDGRGITYSYASPQGLRAATIGARSGAPVALGVAGANLSWSPDGQHLSFVQRVDTLDQLFTARPDGSELTQRTSLDYCCGMARWSPDGQRILFVGDEGNGRSLFAAAASSDYETPLATGVVPGNAVAWSADAAKIAFADATGDLYVSLAGGGGATLIVAGAEVTGGMDW